MKTNICIMVDGDMFADGLIFLLEKSDVKIYRKLLKKTVVISDSEIETWSKSFEEGIGARGFVAVKEMENDGKWHLVVFTGMKNWEATLAHEALHAAERMCEHRGIPISKDTEELRAMLISKIVSKVL